MQGGDFMRFLPFLFLFLLFPLLPVSAQRPMSAYEQALQQEARRKQQAIKAQNLRNRYRIHKSAPAVNKGKAPVRYSPPPQKALPTGRRVTTPPARKQPLKSAAPRAVYPSPVRPRPAAAVRPAARPQPQTAKKIATARIGQHVYFYLRDIAAYYNMRLYFHKDGVEMRSPAGSRVRFYKKRRNGYINGTLVHFLFPLYLRGKTGYFIHSEDVRVLLHPLLRAGKTPRPKAAKEKLIVLDPGHGGNDTGALVPSMREKDMNLLMAWKVRKVLQSFGYRVRLTRTGDTTLSLKERAALCRKWKPDLFISLHCNATGDKKVRGIETFATTPRNTASTGKKAPAHTKADPGNKFDAENFRLAYLVQRSLLSYTAAPDRGVRHARFLVIRESIAPAILIEMGFLTNAAEVKNFRLAAYQNKLANGIAVGIHLYAKER